MDLFSSHIIYVHTCIWSTTQQNEFLSSIVSKPQQNSTSTFTWHILDTLSRNSDMHPYLGALFCFDETLFFIFIYSKL
jgi:hypothetical protein